MVNCVITNSSSSMQHFIYVYKYYQKIFLADSPAHQHEQMEIIYE